MQQVCKFKDLTQKSKSKRKVGGYSIVVEHHKVLGSIPVQKNEKRGGGEGKKGVGRRGRGEGGKEGEENGGKEGGKEEEEEEGEEKGRRRRRIAS